MTPRGFIRVHDQGGLEHLVNVAQIVEVMAADEDGPTKICVTFARCVSVKEAYEEVVALIVVATQEA